jgi:hypothetical protein
MSSRYPVIDLQRMNLGIIIITYFCYSLVSNFEHLNHVLKSRERAARYQENAQGQKHQPVISNRPSSPWQSVLHRSLGNIEIAKP